MKKPAKAAPQDTASKPTWVQTRRMQLLQLSCQMCGANIHPDEITRVAGMMDEFVVSGKVPKEMDNVVHLAPTPGGPTVKAASPLPIRVPESLGGNDDPNTKPQ